MEESQDKKRKKKKAHGSESPRTDRLSQSQRGIEESLVALRRTSSSGSLRRNRSPSNSPSGRERAAARLVASSPLKRSMDHNHIHTLIDVRNHRDDEGDGSLAIAFAEAKGLTDKSLKEAATGAQDVVHGCLNLLCVHCRPSISPSWLLGAAWAACLGLGKCALVASKRLVKSLSWRTQLTVILCLLFVAVNLHSMAAVITIFRANYHLNQLDEVNPHDRVTRSHGVIGDTDGRREQSSVKSVEGAHSMPQLSSRNVGGAGTDGAPFRVQSKDKLNGIEQTDHARSQEPVKQVAVLLHGDPAHLVMTASSILVNVIQPLDADAFLHSFAFRSTPQFLKGFSSDEITLLQPKRKLLSIPPRNSELVVPSCLDSYVGHKTARDSVRQFMLHQVGIERVFALMTEYEEESQHTYQYVLLTSFSLKVLSPVPYGVEATEAQATFSDARKLNNDAKQSVGRTRHLASEGLEDNPDEHESADVPLRLWLPRASDMGGYTQRLLFGDRGSILLIARTLELIADDNSNSHTYVRGPFNTEMLWKNILSVHDVQVSRFDLAMCIVGEGGECINRDELDIAAGLTSLPEKSKFVRYVAGRGFYRSGGPEVGGLEEDPRGVVRRPGQSIESMRYAGVMFGGTSQESLSQCEAACCSVNECRAAVYFDPLEAEGGVSQGWTEKWNNVCYLRIDTEWTEHTSEIFYTTSSAAAEILGLPAVVSEKLCGIDDGSLSDTWTCDSLPLANGPILQNHV
eukprot:scaffold115_cov304-Prasinococcus_capsulatus_cf.AAC.47